MAHIEAVWGEIPMIRNSMVDPAYQPTLREALALGVGKAHRAVNYCNYDFRNVRRSSLGDTGKLLDFPSPVFWAPPCRNPRSLVFSVRSPPCLPRRGRPMGTVFPMRHGGRCLPKWGVELAAQVLRVWGGRGLPGECPRVYARET